MNRAVSLRSSKSRHEPSPSQVASKSSRFTFSSLRGATQPNLSKRLFRLIKTENSVIQAYETAAKEQQNVAGQLSLWGEETGDEMVSDVSDKLGVLLSEIAETEDMFSTTLEDSRVLLKSIRNTESSVHPTRENRQKIMDQIAHLKHASPTSPKIVILEQELVRAEAENLVAEAQLTNITRNKLKEAYGVYLEGLVERCQRQEILAKHARRILELLDDTPVVPGAPREAWEGERTGKSILIEAEEELSHWTAPEEFSLTARPSGPGLESNLLPAVHNETASVEGSGAGDVSPKDMAKPDREVEASNLEPNKEDSEGLEDYDSKAVEETV